VPDDFEGLAPASTLSIAAILLKEINPSATFQDIEISDNDDIYPDTGAALVTSVNSSLGCWHKQEACGQYCYDASMAFKATVKLSPSGSIGPKVGIVRVMTTARTTL